jgi:hypothetical protein
MGLFDKIKQTLSLSKKDEPDTCASGYPDWEPSGTWTPEFEDNISAEAYDGD